MKKVIKDFFSKLMLNILKNDMTSTIIFRFYIEKFKNLVANLHDKAKYVIHIRNVKHD